MRAILLVLFLASSGAVLLTAPAESDCLVDYATGSEYTLGALPIQYPSGKPALSGNYAYLPGFNGIFIIDISNPFSPQLAGTIGAPRATAVAVSGPYVYVTEEKPGKLVVFDVSNPAAPESLGAVSLPAYTYPFQGMRLDVSGSFVYVPDTIGGLQIIDVSDPTTPTIVGSVPTPSQELPFLDVIVSGTYAYVSGEAECCGQVTIRETGIVIIDISNPASPFIVGSLENNNGLIYGITLSGSYLYVADYYLGLQVVDVSNPASPTILSTLQTPGTAHDVAVSDSVAYVASGSSGLTVVNVSNPHAPTLIGGATGGSVTVTVKDSLLYSTGVSDFRIYPTQCSGLAPSPLPGPISARLIRTWGSFGTAPGQFKNPSSIAIDETQAIYVSEQSNNRIQKFDSTGVFLGMWGSGGAGPGQLSGPRGIDIGSDGMVYVSDYDNSRVSVFTPGGSFLRNITYGISPYNLVTPIGIDCEPSGNLWVTGAHGLHHFSSTGEALQFISTEPGATATAIAVEDSTLYVSVCDGDRIDKYSLTPDPSTQLPFTQLPFPARNLDCPEGSTLDADGNLWVCDTNHFRIMKYDSSGAWLGWLQLSTNPQAVPSDIAFDKNGDLYIVDSEQNAVSKYALVATPPTDVVLSSFQALSQAGGILLAWTTSSETDFAGFHVQRSLQRDTGYRQIDTELLAPPSPYRYLDENLDAGVTYYYRLEAVDRSGDHAFFGPISVTATAVARLQQNRPNPFLGNSTIIPFILSKYGDVTLRILDLSGRQVRLLVNERMSPGERQILWDGKNDRGETVSAGVYVYDLTAPAFRASRRLVKIR
jgi:sugar lactone lactonase YvrE